jgi:hypothetical protein
MTLFKPGKIVIPDTPVHIFNKEYNIPQLKFRTPAVIRKYDSGIYRILFYKDGHIQYLKIENNKLVYLKRIWPDGDIKNHDSLVNSIDVLTFDERAHYRIRGIDLWNVM